VPELKTIPKLAANMDGILSQIVDLRAGKPTAIRVTTLYNDRIDDAGKWDDPGVVAQSRSNLRDYFEAVSALSSALSSSVPCSAATGD
jgi:hypothetical protein